MLRVHSILLWASLMASSTALAQVASSNSQLESGLAKKVDLIFSEWDLRTSPGCALGIIRDGKLIYARGYGMANLEHDIPISAKSVFRIGSTSKQFTAACMILLEQQGKISLSDKIGKYIDFPDYGRAITIGQLVHHTSGIRDYLALGFLAGLREADYYTNAEVLALITRQQALNFAPGTEYLYSNSGYFLLSQIVKKVTDLTLREYAEKHIFKPLGMVNTHFHDDYAEIVKRRAAGYSSAGFGEFYTDMTNLEMVGDGGVFTTIEDLLLWDQNFYQPAVGGKSFIKSMLKPGRLNNGTEINYAAGLFHDEYKGLATVSHGGAFVGFRTEMIRLPAQRVTVMVLCNLGSMRPTALSHQVIDIILAEEIAVAAKVRTHPKEKADSTPPVVDDTIEQNWKAVVGSYWDHQSKRVRRIYQKDGSLYYGRGMGRETELLSIANNRFLMRDVGIVVTVDFKPAIADEPKTMWVKVGERAPMKMVHYKQSPTSEEVLSKLVGHYHCQELQVSYQLRLHKGYLQLVMPNDDPMILQPTIPGSFLVADICLEFGAGMKAGETQFKLSMGRVKNLLFKRRR